MIEPDWITQQEVELLHHKGIEAGGGSQGLRDGGLLASALARPRNLNAYGENDLFELAASYAEAIARNHAFIDGNKRAAFQSADFFLYKNGIELLARKDDGYVNLMVDLGQGQISREEVANYFRENSQQI